MTSIIRSRLLHTALFTLLTVLFTTASIGAAEKIEFNRDIRPILAENCYACHGPDSGQRKADLRLDREDAVRGDRGGYHILVPGKPTKSELYLRVTATDAMQMPPKKSPKKLTKAQIQLLEQWIEQGGDYQKHWSLIAPKKGTPPTVEETAWSRSPIDRFVRARQIDKGLSPAGEADARTLMRRLSFDLTGLPPTASDVETFVEQMKTNPKAYEALVDRLLASPHYGERMAIYWLDVVRYADTNGIHGDNHHDIALYRDYVINAFNRNMSFDRFTLEQLAGDLLPDATLEQKIASGYNRLNMVTREGGAQAKEYRAKYAADRVRNASTVWLGATLGCAECHDHKFDAFTQKDFYSFAAFFADLQETAVGKQPTFSVISEKQKSRLQTINAELTKLNKRLATMTPELREAQEKWEAEAHAKKFKGIPKNIVAILKVPANKRNKKQRADLSSHYRKVAPLLASVRKEVAALTKEKQQIDKATPKTLISMSMPTPRTMRVLPRGNWLDDSGAIVQPNVPASFPNLKVDGRRATRLDLAKWLMANDNPVVARVFVNRLWKLMYGRGLVSTLDDFGTQGNWPSHPDLLDWLAVEFQESGWNIKHMLKLMVMTNAYRQASRGSVESHQQDPYNIWIARQGRFRLDAEMIRDNVLSVSGLLVDRVGGPSVKPYQPVGYWSHLNFPKRVYMHDKDQNQYRRGVYTYWCRTFLHPALLAFDAPTREESCVDRPRSNTPLQALVLLNDPTFVESARRLAERIVREGGTSPSERIAFGYRTVLQRSVRSQELALLERLQREHQQHYTSNPDAAKQLLGVGLSATPEGMNEAELASWTSVARVLLNLHETITRN